MARVTSTSKGKTVGRAVAAAVRRQGRVQTQRIATPAAAQVPEAMMRFTIIGPARLYDSFLTVCQDAFRQTGIKVQFHFDEVATGSGAAVPEPAMAGNGNGNGHVAAPAPINSMLAPTGVNLTPLPSNAAAVGSGVVIPRPGQTRAAARKVATLAINGQARNTVVYQAIDTAPVSGTTKAVVQAFLIRHGAMANSNVGISARQIMDGTQLGQKAVESALHGLRTAGVIRSVAVG